MAAQSRSAAPWVALPALSGIRERIALLAVLEKHVTLQADVDVATAFHPRQEHESLGNGLRGQLHPDRLVAEILV